ncbi:TPA: hypothetical protein ACH3X1_000879 [Trebouxia sp. C0004]
MASDPKLMQALMRDSPTFSKDQPLLLDQQLQAFAREDGNKCFQGSMDHQFGGYDQLFRRAIPPSSRIDPYYVYDWRLRGHCSD